MKKKVIVAILVILIVFALFAGCIRNDLVNTQSFNSKYESNEIISAPTNAYFDEEIEFKALNIDSQSQEKKYYWNFGDGYISEGTNVKHAFEFTNEFEIKYPLIYTITLYVVDQDQTITTNHQIKLYPNKYTFFFDIGKTSPEVPILNYEKIGTNSIFNKDELKELCYKFDEPINISECNWDVTLYLEKPLSLILRKVTVSFFDKNDNMISSEDKNMFFDSIWKENSIQIQGSFNKKEGIASVKILFYGFSFGENIKIFYGTGKPSNICFSF